MFSRTMAKRSEFIINYEHNKITSPKKKRCFDDRILLSTKSLLLDYLDKSDVSRREGGGLGGDC